MNRPTSLSVIAATALVAANLPLLAGVDLSAAFGWFPDRVATGEWWRLFTHPFVHVSSYHAVVDISAFLLLMSLLRGNNARRTAIVIAAGVGSLLGATLAPPAPLSLIGFAGLSGIGHGLLAQLGLDQWRRGARKLGTLLLGGVLLKALAELGLGEVVMSGSHLGDVGLPVVACHLGGVLGVLGLAGLRRWSLATLLSCLLLPAQASEEPLLALFEQRCAACHSPSTDGEEPLLHAGMSLAELRQDTDYVTPGRTDQSLLYKRMVLPADHRRRMPLSRGSAGEEAFLPPLDAEELRLVREWIEGSAPGSPRPAPLQHLQQLALIEQDLASRNRAGHDTRNLRYLSIAHLAAQPGLENRDLERARAAMRKGLNSLSRTAQLHAPLAIDDQDLLYVIQLRDWGWTPALWERIMQSYPYSLEPRSRMARGIRLATETQHPLVRADWLIFVATQPPLYHEVLGQPTSEIFLEQILGVDTEKNLRAGKALRAGFQQSGVSQANRLIERHQQARGGFYWKSYDFARESGNPKQDLFQNPLGPKSARISGRFAFDHDGGEIIYALPNGLPAYYLATAEGQRLDVAPVEIVQDRARLDGKIINGISCMRCHADGLRLPPRGMVDEVRPAFTDLRRMSFRERGLMQRLYPESRVIAAEIAADNAELTRLFEQLGVSGFRSEPIAWLSALYAADLCAEQLAAETERPLSLLLSGLTESADSKLRALEARLRNGGRVPREDVERLYKDIASQLGLGRTVASRIGSRPVFTGEAAEPPPPSMSRLRSEPAAAALPDAPTQAPAEAAAVRRFWE